MLPLEFQSPSLTQQFQILKLVFGFVGHLLARTSRTIEERDRVSQLARREVYVPVGHRDALVTRQLLDRPR